MTQKQFNSICDFARSEMEKGKEPQHDWSHVERVAENAKAIVEILGVSKTVDINLLLSACYLHDLSISKRKPSFFGFFINHLFEGYFIRKYMPSALLKLNLDQKDRKILYNAIKNHPLSFPYRHLNKNKDIYTRILQDSDTLDFFSTNRVKTFSQNESKYLSYKMVEFFKKPLLSYGLNNLDKFLNFPELANVLKLK